MRTLFRPIKPPSTVRLSAETTRLELALVTLCHGDPPRYSTCYETDIFRNYGYFYSVIFLFKFFVIISERLGDKKYSHLA